MLHIDMETQSTCDLSKKGSYEYAIHSSSRVLCMAYSINSDPIQLWTPDLPFPKELITYIEKNRLVSAHNAVFEFNIWNHCLSRMILGLPQMDLGQIECTMAKCYYHSLPGSLDEAAQALGLKSTKDMAGRRVMLQLSSPRKIVNDIPIYYEKDEYPEKFQILYEYCKNDVQVEREIHNALKPLPAIEKKFWRLDYLINKTGVLVDRKSIKLANYLIDLEKEYLDKRMFEITNGEVGTCNQVSKLTAWLKSKSDNISTIGKADVKEILQSETNPIVREALELRQIASKSSTAKLKTMQDCVGTDGRVREMFQYYGAHTGRFAGRKVQLQNFPRPNLKHTDIDAIFDILNQFPTEDAREVIDSMYDAPLNVISDCLRGFLIAGNGHRFIVVDWSSIEARVLAWLAGQEDVLKAFRDKQDLYIVAASKIYNKNEEKITKHERQIGKVACIAEGELVLTDKGIVPIEKITLCHKVWDGLSWVNHGGVVYKGEKEVISYDGLVATKDHIVWAEDGRNLCFGECAEQQIPLLKTGFGGQKIRMGDDTFPGNKMAWRKRQARAFSKISTRILRMLGVCFQKMDQFKKFKSWKNRWVRNVFTSFASAQMAFEKSYGHEAEMPKRFGFKLSELWWARDTFQFRLCSASGPLDSRKFRAQQIFRHRQDRQQRSLRKRKFEICDPIREREESTTVKNDNARRSLGQNKKPFFLLSILLLFKKKISKRSHHWFGIQGRDGQEKKLEKHSIPPKKSRVYDIVNAGPNNRFTVSNCLVHNCLALGYQGGVRAFQMMSKVYGLEISEAEADTIKTAWRESNKNIVRYWYALNEAAIRAVQEKVPQSVGQKNNKVTFVLEDNFLKCKLPSGRDITYPFPKVEKTTFKYNDEEIVRDALGYKGRSSVSKKWIDIKTYGGKFAEQITQGLSRDILRDALLALNAKGYKIVMHIHDEIVCEMPSGTGSLEEMSDIMCSSSPWAVDLPLGAEGWEGQRYGKE